MIVHSGGQLEGEVYQRRMAISKSGTRQTGICSLVGNLHFKASDPCFINLVQNEMKCWIRSEVFDHGILHSSVKWCPSSISSFLEELKLVCPNRTITQSKWLETVSTKMALSEAQCYWSMFMSCRQSILGQVGEWMDLGTLGIFLFSQVYAQARARADSTQHNEALFHSLATTMAIPSNMAVSPGGQRSVSHKSQLLSSSAKLVRDNSRILQFIESHLPLLINVVTVCPLNFFTLHSLA